MKIISYKPDGLLPGVVLDKDSGKMQIFGKSCPLNAFEFFDPIFEWFDEYMANPLEQTVLDLNLTYFNTVSAKFLLRIMNLMDELHEKGYKVKIKWYYEQGDEDMREEGEEFSNILEVEFEFIELEDEAEISDDDAFFEEILESV
jgi:hypothetical protein